MSNASGRRRVTLVRTNSSGGSSSGGSVGLGPSSSSTMFAGGTGTVAGVASKLSVITTQNPMSAQLNMYTSLSYNDSSSAFPSFSPPLPSSSASPSPTPSANLLSDEPPLIEERTTRSPRRQQIGLFDGQEF